MPYTNTCQNPACGRSFTQNKRPHAKYCSTACKYACYVKPRAVVIAVPCAACGATLERIPSRMERTTQQFCNRACHARWMREHGPRGDQHQFYSQVEVVCTQCGVAFSRQRWQLQRYRLPFCSLQCQAAYKALHALPQGAIYHRPDSPSYRGPNWTKQARAARERDQRTCQKCGIREDVLGRRLDVHHIVPFHTFGYVPDQNDHYRAANDLANLISLCPRCHQLVEWNGF